MRREQGVITHAHSDHVAPNRRSVLSIGTLRLLQPFQTQPQTLPFGETLTTERYVLSLHPAGHVLGSAQVLVQSRLTGERVLYTGDFKTWPNPTAEPLQPVPCDTLIMEATYGRAHYRFPPEAEALARGVALIRQWLAEGCVPVALGYRVGKAQEILHHLLAAGFQVAVEPATYQVARAYEELGVRFPRPYREYDGSPRDGEVLLFPPSLKRCEALERLPRRKTVMFSGWALNRDAARRFGVDEMVPLSDHADFDQLVEYASRVGARRVYTVNGFPDLAGHLRRLGYDARHFNGPNNGSQLPLL